MTSTNKTRLYLWDVDGTLLDAGGAGRQAFHDAFVARYRVEAPFRDESFTGRTDLAIFRGAAIRTLGREALADEEACFFRDYLAMLSANVQTTATFRVMPGIESLLRAMTARPDCRVGLCTGNLEAGAAIKLAKAGLQGFFGFGGFGSDHADRVELTRLAIERGRVGLTGEVETWVIGDSPHEHRAARANGVRVALVGTGWTPVEELQSLQPDLFFESFADWPAALDVLSSNREAPVVGTADMAAAVQVVRASGLLLYPTATLYGIGGNALDEDVVRRVHHVKQGRGGGFIVLVDDVERAMGLVRDPGELAYRLAARFWPGPLTLVLPAGDRVPRHLTGPDGTIAVRLDAHPWTAAVVREAGVPLLSTSANAHGMPAPGRVEDLGSEVRRHCDLQVHDAAPLGGEPSTLVRLTGQNIEVLRAGAIPESDLRAAVGRETPSIGGIS